MSVIVPNVMQIGHAIAEIRPFIDFLKMAAVHHFGFVIRLFWTNHEVYLVVFVTVQNLVGIRCMF